MEKKLYRSTSNRMISGVCGGIAEYFDLDTTLIRIGVVILGFASFFTLIIGYIVCAIVIPERPYDLKEEDVEYYDSTGNKINHRNDSKNSGYIIGIILIAVGSFWLMNELFWWFDKGIFWGIAIVALGIFILVGGRDKANKKQSEENNTSQNNQ